MLIFECTCFGVMTAETDQKACSMHTGVVAELRPLRIHIANPDG
jgi:hypothetical protein